MLPALKQPFMDGGKPNAHARFVRYAKSPRLQCLRCPSLRYWLIDGLCFHCHQKGVLE